MRLKEKAMPVHATLGLTMGFVGLLAGAAWLAAGAAGQASGDRPRARESGLIVGVLPPGPLNAITDVAGVKVGQVTVVAGRDVRTGVTANLPHGDNIFQDKVPAGISVSNGYGKLTGVTQVEELGTLETPIVLTNTLSAHLELVAALGEFFGGPAMTWQPCDELSALSAQPGADT